MKIRQELGFEPFNGDSGIGIFVIFMKYLRNNPQITFSELYLNGTRSIQ